MAFYTAYEESKLVICGTGGVGKSCLTIQMVQNAFCTDYDPTIEDSYRKTISVDDKVTMMDILDTAGQEEFSVMRDMYMRSGEGFMLVYSITSRHSFDGVVEFYNQILRVKDVDKVPMLLVGNKADLEEQRQVSSAEGALLAQQWGIPFYETSAATRQDVDTVFQQLVREIRDDRLVRRGIEPKAHKKAAKKLGVGKALKPACSIL